MVLTHAYDIYGSIEGSPAIVFTLGFKAKSLDVEIVAGVVGLAYRDVTHAGGGGPET